MPKFKDLTGEQFTYLTVISRHSKKGVKATSWNCVCKCGNTSIAYASDLKAGKTKSCGCFKGQLSKERNTTHGISGSRLTTVLNNMKARCYNKNLDSYKNYGGRGITICDEWLNSYPAFIAWAEANGYEETLTIERVDNDKGYSPENCIWASRSRQSANCRKVSGTSSKYIGVSWRSRESCWAAAITYEKVNKSLGYYASEESAAKARNAYIIEKGLPHKLNILE